MTLPLWLYWLMASIGGASLGYLTGLAVSWLSWRVRLRRRLVKR